MSRNSRTSLRSAETEIGKWRTETSVRNPHPKDGNARNCPPETRARQPNPREDQRFSQTRKNQPGDRTAWLTTQSEANRSHPVTPCFPLLCSEKQAIFPFCGTTSGQHFFKFCRLFRWLWCFSFDARAAIIPPQNRDIFFNVSGTRDLITGENSKRVRKRQLRSSPLLSLTLRSATAQGAPGHPRACVHSNGSAGPSGPGAGRQASKTKDFLTRIPPAVTLFRLSA
jgi:hypothetical protein